MNPEPWTCPPDRRPHLRAVVTLETVRAAMAGRPIPRACRRIDSVLNHLDARESSLDPRLSASICVNQPSTRSTP
jgi:hypothetical protein